MNTSKKIDLVNLLKWFAAIIIMLLFFIYALLPLLKKSFGAFFQGKTGQEANNFNTQANVDDLQNTHVPNFDLNVWAQKFYDSLNYSLFGWFEQESKVVEYVQLLTYNQLLYTSKAYKIKFKKSLKSEITRLLSAQNLAIIQYKLLNIE